MIAPDNLTANAQPESAYEVRLDGARRVVMGRYPNGNYYLLFERPVRADDQDEPFDPALKYPNGQRVFSLDGSHREIVLFSPEACAAVRSLIDVLVPSRPVESPWPSIQCECGTAWTQEIHTVCPNCSRWPSRPVEAAPELPACAAYWNPNNGLIVAGIHHAECLQKMHLAGLGQREFRDGFVSTRGRFLHREEAFTLFEAAGLSSSSGTSNHCGWLLAGGRLDSGDLPGIPAGPVEEAPPDTPYLVNHADGVDGSYCIARRMPDNPVFEEYWSKGKWAGAGEVFKLHSPRKAVPAPPADTAPLPDGVGLIAAERLRQISAEGWSATHDDNEHLSGELEDAAICYLFANGSLNPETCPLNTRWPWDDKWWKPSNDPIRNLVKAGALVAAEIDRLQRTAHGKYGNNIASDHIRDTTKMVPDDTREPAEPRRAPVPAPPGMQIAADEPACDYIFGGKPAEPTDKDSLTVQTGPAEPVREWRVAWNRNGNLFSSRDGIPIEWLKRDSRNVNPRKQYSIDGGKTWQDAGTSAAEGGKQ